MATTSLNNKVARRQTGTLRPGPSAVKGRKRGDRRGCAPIHTVASTSASR